MKVHIYKSVDIRSGILGRLLWRNLKAVRQREDILPNMRRVNVPLVIRITALSFWEVIGYLSLLGIVDCFSVLFRMLFGSPLFPGASYTSTVFLSISKFSMSRKICCMS